MKNVNNFQIANVQPPGVAQHLFDVSACQIQPGVAYKSVAYKKKRANEKNFLGVEAIILSNNFKNQVNI